MKALEGKNELSMQDARYLGSLVQASDPSRPIIEIGTLYGWSTSMICLFKDPEQPLFTVDDYSWNQAGLSPEEHYALTTNRLRPLIERENVTQCRVDKDSFYDEYDGPPPALFFCDADHSYEATKRDLKWARSVNASTICGDDYCQKFPGVIRAVNEMGVEFTVIDRLFVLDNIGKR